MWKSEGIDFAPMRAREEMREVRRSGAAAPGPKVIAESRLDPSDDIEKVDSVPSF